MLLGEDISISWFEGFLLLLFPPVGEGAIIAYCSMGSYMSVKVYSGSYSIFSLLLYIFLFILHSLISSSGSTSERSLPASMHIKER